MLRQKKGRIRTTSGTKLLLGSISIVLLTAAARTHSGSECPLAGRWQSNETRTLRDMNEHGSVNDSQRALFSRPGFFGRFIREFSCTHERGYFVENGADGAEWAPYRIKERTASFVVLEFDGQQELERIEMQGSCFRTPLRDMNFHEYFCRQ